MAVEAARAEAGSVWIVGPAGEMLGAADEDGGDDVGRRRLLMRNAILRRIVISESAQRLLIE